MKNDLLIRCSSLSKIIGRDPTKLSETAKSHIVEIAKENLFGFRSFEGSKYTEKGIKLEDEAIQLSAFYRGTFYEKNTERRENEFITGECDIYDEARNVIIDIKCPWDISTHPFFTDEAEKKSKKAGYDWQMQGYLWLWNAEFAEIDFWLLPTPEELLSNWDDQNKFIGAVLDIDEEQRRTTVKVERDEEKIEIIKQAVTTAREYYNQLIKEWEAKLER